MLVTNPHKRDKETFSSLLGGEVERAGGGFFTFYGKSKKNKWKKYHFPNIFCIFAVKKDKKPPLLLPRGGGTLDSILYKKLPPRGDGGGYEQ